jgi:hypothetical protein
VKAEVAELLARAEAADQAEVADGMSIPEELARREERLAKLAEARAKLEARAKERFEREMAEHRAKLAAPLMRWASSVIASRVIPHRRSRNRRRAVAELRRTAATVTADRLGCQRSPSRRCWYLQSCQVRS